MKKIGIIGGAGPLASSLLYESIIHQCYASKVAVPEIFILNFPFTRCLTPQEKESQSQQVFEELVYCVRRLEEHRVEIGLLACNTLHLILRQLPRTKIQFFALPELVLSFAKEAKVQKLLFLGTQNSCHSGLYHDPNMQIIYPNKKDQAFVDEVIDRVLEGIIKNEDAHLLEQVIEKSALENNFDGVILGCTDLPVLHHHYPVSSKFVIYDSIKLPAKIIGGTL